MAGERFQDVYEFNLRGNYREELDRLSASIQQAQSAWGNLRASLGGGSASFKKTARELKALAEQGFEVDEASERAASSQVKLATVTQTLGNAQARLVREQNKLRAVRESELAVLNQVVGKSKAGIINARAEAAALQKLTKALTEKATADKFRALAAKEGLQVSADGKKVFNAEAIAAERAAKAVQQLAVAEQLRKRGFDPSGQPQKFDQTTGALTPAGQQAIQQKAQSKVEAALAKEAELRILSKNQAYLDAVKGGKVLEKQMNSLTSVAERTEGGFNRVGFTFRRLIGIMAAFTIARQVVNQFNQMIAGAIRLSAQLETTQLGIAGLIASAAEIRSPIGEKLGIDKQVLATQRIALDQMGKLRRDALVTSATYVELSDAFQQAISPGLQSGFTLDQIRETTVSISQAATALGLTQRQLAEEIRSLFTGTISAQNSRIALALGITSKDIDTARQLGNQYEFLRERFAGLSAAGDKLAQTFTGIASNALDAFQQILAESSKPLFEELKKSLSEIQNAIASTTNDAVVFKPDALKAFQGLFEGLANGVRGIRAAFQSIDVTAFSDSLSALGTSLGVIASAIAKALVTIVNISAPAVTIFAGILNNIVRLAAALKTVAGEWGGVVAQVAINYFRILLVLKVLGRMKILVLGVATAWKTARAAMVAGTAATEIMALATTRVGKATTLLAVGFKKVLLPVLAIAAALAIIDQVLKAFGSKFSFISIIGEGFAALDGVLDGLTDKLLGVKEQLEEGPDSSGFAQVIEDFRDLRAELDEFALEAEKTLRALDAEGVAARSARNLPQNFGRIETETLTERAKAFENTLRIQRQIEAQEGSIAQSIQASTKAQDEVVKAKLNIQAIDDSLLVLAAQKLKLEQKISAESLKASTGIAPLIQREDDKKKLENINRLIDEQTKKLNGQLQAQVANQESAKTAIQGQAIAEAQKKKLLEILDQQIAKEREIENARRTNAFDQDTFETNLRLPSLTAETQEARDLDAAFRAVDATRQEIAERTAARVRAEIDLERNLLVLNNAISNLQGEIAERGQAKTDSEAKLLQSLRANLDSRRQELVLEEGLGKARVDRLKAEEELARLRREGTGVQGVARGFQLFAAENASGFNLGEQFGQQLAGAIPQFAGQALRTTIAAAFDKTQNVDLSDAIADIGASIAIDLATQLVSGAVANALSGLFGALGDALSNTSAAAATETAAFSLALAGKEVAAAIGTATTAMAGSLTSLLAAINSAATAAAGAAAGASVAGAAGGLAKGGAVDRMRRFHLPNINETHRNAAGFARGGRPAGIDPRDTIPAFLRPGEWVIRPEAVQHYGDALFDLLNRRKLSPDALRGVAKSRSATRARPIPKMGFATGGPVSTRANIAPAVAPILLQFHDEQTMDRAMAAGPQAPVRFARRRRSAYRAALGIDPET